MVVGRRQAAAGEEGAALFAVNFEASTSRRLLWSVHRDLSLNFCCRVFLRPGDVARGMSHFCKQEKLKVNYYILCRSKILQIL